MTARQLCKLLEREGWLLKRINGSHHIYSKPGQDKILSIPVHGNKNLKPGILSHLLSQAGLKN
jgi:predicted RNA binding protein YcfA (HicA-like mRNA interferase family)